MKINKYVDISTLDKEAKKDYIDRHSVFVSAEGEAKKGEKFKVNVKVGDEYSHPDDFDHYIAWIQLWDGETQLGQITMNAGALGSAPSQLEVDFYVVPTKSKMKLTAHSYCTKHGLWQSDEIIVSVI